MLGIARHCEGSPLISKPLAGRAALAGEGNTLLLAGQGGERRDRTGARVRAGVPSAYTNPLLTAQVGNSSSSRP